MRRARGIPGHPVGRLGLLAAGVLTVAILVVATTPQLLGSELGRAVSDLGRARPVWLWLAGAAFLGSLVGTAGAWRTTLVACGAPLSLRESCARYGIGSLVNTFVPYRLGDVVRVGLFARVLERRERNWTASGAFGAIGVARASCVVVLVAVAAAMGAMPLWPLLVLVGLAPVVALVVSLACRHRPSGRIAHLLDACLALARAPRQAARLLLWIGAATVARVLAAAAIGAALRVHSPLAAAFLIVTALDVAGQLPLTPGNVGITSGAVAVALASRGVGLDMALSTGLAFHAVETAVGLSFGAAGVLHLARFGSPAARRLVAQLAAATAAAVLVAGFSVTVLVDVA